MDAVFTAANISGIATAVGALVVGFVAVDLIFLGGKLVKKTLGRG